MNRLLHLRSILVLAALIAASFTMLAFANLGVATDPDLGDHLVTEDGYVLYVFLPDEQGDSTCYDGCASAWPPLLADGDVGVPEGLEADLLGTVERDDGTTQITYGGWPLYTFARDSEPGMASGQGASDNWYVIAPDGTVVGAELGEMSDGGGEEVAMSQEEYDALFRTGNRAYLSVCSSCHGRNGDESNAAHVKLLAENDNLADAEYVITQILNGRGYMAGFASALSDEQAAGIATFIRGSWGNDYGPVREEDIAEYR